jgi:hypothetical protein
MKLKQIIFAATAICIFGITSCKKSKVDNTELENTFELAANGSVADNLTQDAQEVLNEAAVDKGIAGSGIVAGAAETTGILSCAMVTVTPLIGFPKNIVIDFGTAGCTSPNGITRRGKILVTLTDSLRRPGSVATMTFDAYTIGIHKKEGTITWTNTSTAAQRSWRRVCVNGKITNTVTNNYWLHSGTQDIVQTAGTNTPNILIDDVFSITGNRTVTKSNGVIRVGTVLTALQKKTICNNIDKGTYKIEGPNHVAIIDFGDGTCDNQATVTIDGNPPRNITLN